MLEMGATVSSLVNPVYAAIVTGALLTSWIVIRTKYPWLWQDLRYIYHIVKSFAIVFKRIGAKETIIDRFELQAKRQPKKTFLLFKDEKYSYEYAEKQANKVADVARSFGLKQNDVVAVMIKNEPAFIWTYLGVLKLGVRPALINFNLRSKSLLHCIRVCETKTLLLGRGEDLLNAVTEIFDELKKDGITVLTQGDANQNIPAEFVTFDKTSSNTSQETEAGPIRKQVDNFTDPHCYVFTSGTTGLPKAAVISRTRALKAATIFSMCGGNSDDIVYTPLPLYHSAACLIALGFTIDKGATLALREKFSATNFWNDCRKYNVTVIQYIGELCRYLCSIPKTDRDADHSVKMAIGNGLRPDVWREFNNRFKVPAIMEFYAATEGTMGFLNIFNKFGAVGRQSPLLGLFLPVRFLKYDRAADDVVRDKNGFCIEAKIGEHGLMVGAIKKNFEYDGYKGVTLTKDRKVLRDVFKKGDSYFNSGDLVELDDMYYIYFKDRVGDTFRWKGENVSTTEVGNVIVDMPWIEDANVYGVQIEGHDGRAGMAAITLIDGCQVTEEQIADLYRHCETTLPAYARPLFLRIKQHMEVTSTFKQKKIDLVADGIDIEKMAGDAMYIANARLKTYTLCTKNVYEMIKQEQIRL